MSDAADAQNSSRPGADDAQQSAAEELAPIEPPNARFLTRLFLIPGLIVVAVVAVWLLFGRLASSDQDWRQLMTDLRSDDEHRQWYGAAGLVHLLAIDAQRKTEKNRLSQNTEIATELSRLLKSQLQQTSHSEDDRKLQTYLASTLGWLDVPDTVIPVLQETIHQASDAGIRKRAIASIALIAGRAMERGHSLEVPSLVQDLSDVTQSPDPRMRRLGAYTLGLFADAKAQERLQTLLNDPDQDTRLNAAIGLARHDSSAGLDTLHDVLLESVTMLTTRPENGESIDAQQVFTKRAGQLVKLRNALRAIGRLATQLPAHQQDDLSRWIRVLIEESSDPQVRTDAQTALHALDVRDD